MSDREYRLITSVAGQNFGEDMRLPDAALQLEEVYRPEAFEDATEAERAGSGQVCDQELAFAPASFYLCSRACGCWLLSCRLQEFQWSEAFRNASVTEHAGCMKTYACSSRMSETIEVQHRMAL